MSLQGLKYYEKTEGRRNSRVWADLARQDAKLGNLERAEEWLKMWKNQPVDAPLIDPQGLLSQRDELRSQAVFSAAKNQWEEAYQNLEKALEIAEKIPLYNVFSQIVVRTDYAWVLNRHGRVEKAKVHLAEIQKLLNGVDHRFAHVNVDAHLMAPWNLVAGDLFEIRVDLANISRKPGVLVKVEELLLPEFEVISSSDNCFVANGLVDIKENKIGPFEVETIRLKLKAAKDGTYALSPQVIFVDEMEETRTCKTNPITITVKPAKPKYEKLPGRVSTGLEKLDALLFGGVPEKYAVVLTAASTGERRPLVKKFLETGATAGETTFQVTTEAENSQALAKKYPSNFFLFVCNPQADAVIQDLPNVFKLKGVENLTDIDIALAKAFRKLSPTENGAKRICIEVMSDVLLQHHALNTRRWLAALLPTLKSKGFTILSAVDPQMHPPEETQAVLGLFDGEITIQEKEMPCGISRFLRVRRLTNQKYVKEEIEL
jgi:KaiC/GvpD/RAD55 family RecA-like ATPase